MADTIETKWRDKAEIDYFPPFISLWLSFNEWYRKEYQTNQDRESIEKIKKSIKFLTALENKLTRPDKDSIRFREDLEQFHFALTKAEIPYYYDEPKNLLTLENAIINYSDQENECVYISLLMTAGVNSEGKEDEEDEEDEESYPLYQIKITNNHSDLMSGLMEIIYKIRCHLFHGNLNPNDVNHEVVKYAYFVLKALMPRV